MDRLTGTLSRLGKRKIMVIGDLMLDTYTIGKAKRISPEAPVAIVHVIKEESLAGGAGNVALNILSLGSDVVLVGRIGHDRTGEILSQALKDSNISLEGIFSQPNYKTPLKNRVIADNQQIVRVDHEEISQLPEVLEDLIIEALPRLLEGVDAVAISDYGKGFLTKTLLAAVIEKSKELKIPVITDPKGIDFAKYSGSTIIKPNLSEAYAAARLLQDASLDLVAERLLPMCNAEMLMITRSESGISIFHKDGTRKDFPAKIREVKDVTGAGDTVLAMMCQAFANDLGVEIAASLSNIAAGIAIEHFGCSRVTLENIAERLLEDDVTNKVFDDEHLFALQKVLGGKGYTLLGLSCQSGMTTTVFSAIHQLTKQLKTSDAKDSQLVIFMLDEECDPHFIDLLASIHDVKFIIVKSHNLNGLCELISPNAVYVVKDESLTKLSSYHQLLIYTK